MFYYILHNYENYYFSLFSSQDLWNNYGNNYNFNQSGDSVDASYSFDNGYYDGGPPNRKAKGTNKLMSNKNYTYFIIGNINDKRNGQYKEISLMRFQTLRL